MAGSRYHIEVRAILPEPLARLNDLAGDLTYSWDRRIRGLFRRIDSALWDRCHHNPKVLLRHVAQPRLERLARDPDFLAELEAAVAAFDQYRAATDPRARSIAGLEAPDDQVAYLCMEFGLHESMHLYSGGLGILAGDHCKAASDIGMPFVAVGLMYRQGFFQQTIDRNGRQQAHYQPVALSDLPVELVRGDDGQPIEIGIPFAARTVRAQVWQARVGHVPILLLDTELEANAPEDRSITYQLYGGGSETRIAQEIVLGIGGVRALRALGFRPTAWHINEGHPAFSILERCREQVEGGLDFASALDAVAAATVFTTHTPVPAGHDLFDTELMETHFGGFAEALGIPLQRLLDLGRVDEDETAFNMTTLALRGSRRHNGVSRIHGGVASCMEHAHWPEVPAGENPITYVTNGVHVPTFLAREWAELFDAEAPGWRSRVADPDFWREAVESIPDARFWSIRQLLKTHFLGFLRSRLAEEYARRGWSAGRIRSMQRALGSDRARTLVIGFARRFATYKRALLLFQDPERLARLLGDPERPVILVFAGKAHPQDEPGQALIRQLVERACEERFRDRLFFCEDYGMTLARHLVTGVDVWLNNPEYPMEASGTSGQKAAANGVVNVSVLDGWWAEAYDGRNGWAVEPHPHCDAPEERDATEAEELLDLLEHEVIPAWYAADATGLPVEWIERAKASMSTILPRFNAERMVREYAQRLYGPAARHGRALAADGAARARELARWREHVRERWDGVQLRWAEHPPTTIRSGEPLELSVAVTANGLAPESLHVEAVLETDADGGTGAGPVALECVSADPVTFTGRLRELPNGLVSIQVRACPRHPDLAHPYEMGLMRWL